MGTGKPCSYRPPDEQDTESKVDRECDKTDFDGRFRILSRSLSRSLSLPLSVANTDARTDAQTDARADAWT